MLKAHGYATWTNGGRGTERDTCQCCHCGAVVVVKPGTGCTVYLIASVQGWREEAGAWCGCCSAPVCLRCHADGRCLPLERQLERLEHG